MSDQSGEYGRREADANLRMRPPLRVGPFTSRGKLFLLIMAPSAFIVFAACVIAYANGTLTDLRLYPQNSIDRVLYRDRSNSNIIANSCDGRPVLVVLDDKRSYIELPKCHYTLNVHYGSLDMLSGPLVQKYPSPAFDWRRSVDKIRKAYGNSSVEFEIVFCPYGKPWNAAMWRCG